MTVTPGFIAFLEEQLAPLGPVAFKRMFGGAGIWHGGLMFALIADDTLHFKVDERSQADFEAEGMGPFTYATKNGEHRLTSYWRAPERLFDEPDELLRFARTAIAASERKSAKMAPKRKAAARPARRKTPRDVEDRGA